MLLCPMIVHAVGQTVGAGLILLTVACSRDDPSSSFSSSRKKKGLLNFLLLHLRLLHLTTLSTFIILALFLALSHYTSRPISILKMPQTEARSDDDLAIKVERDTYTPGETVTGNITRVSALVDSEVTLSVVLHGRAKSKFMDRNDRGATPRRGRYELLKVKQNVFKGPMQIPGNTEPRQWSFAVQIPTHVDASHYPGNHKGQDALIDIDYETVSKMELPGSFMMGQNSGYSRREGFVEYYLEAVFEHKRSGSAETATAVVPIQLRARNTAPPLVDFSLVPFKNEKKVTTQRLLPGMENAELSAMDSVKKFFGTPSVPDFAFKIETHAPSVFQIDQPSIPLFIRVVPNWSDSSEEIRGKPAPKARVVCFRGVLASFCDILCASGKMGFARHEQWWEEDHELEGDGYDLRPLAIDVPCGDDVEAADLGAAMHLRLPRSIFPSFTTFNIHLRWKLDFWVYLDIAGEETHVHEHIEQVTVIPASSGPPPGV